MTEDYDLDATTPLAKSLQSTYKMLSEGAVGLPGATLDAAYGAHPSQKLDVFPAGSEDPVIVFFHGGYWRAGTKDVRRFPALAWRPRGVSWVTVNYRLTPEATLFDAIDDARRAVDWVAGNAARLGLSRKIHVTGNSAGGHLAAMVAADPHSEVCSLAAISGVYDLEPLLDGVFNDWLHLNQDTARAASPIFCLPPRDLPVLVGHGGNENKVFKTQAHGFAETCRSAGCLVTELVSPGVDHFEMIGEYGAPDTPLFAALERLILSV